MKSFLVSNTSARKHKAIYRELGENAVFDLSPSQHGWDDFKSASIGDAIYVINERLRITLSYEITQISDGILLEEDSGLAQEVLSVTSGDVRVVFGKPLQRIDKEYPSFVREHNIRNNKLNPDSHTMYVGFNCAAF